MNDGMDPVEAYEARRRRAWARRALHALVVIACALTAVGLPVQAVPNCATETNPDIIVGAVYDILPFGSFNSITAYGIGATACNVGTCRANWFGSSSAHPVIAQNLFRLKNGRFEQIGQSWV